MISRRRAKEEKVTGLTWGACLAGAPSADVKAIEKASTALNVGLI